MSYVLNGAHDSPTGKRISISSETRQRVLDAIATLRYEPNARAQSLRRGKTNTIGLLFPTLQNPYFGQILYGISSEAQSAGYSLHMSQNSATPEQEAYSLKDLAQQRVDGLILLFGFSRVSARIVESLRHTRRPIVQITATASEFDHVLNGYAEATRTLMNYLFGLGHTRIGFVYGVAEEAQGHDRLLTYHQVLQETGQRLNGNLVAHCGPTIEEGYRAARNLLTHPERPTALLVINDLLAIAVVRAAADLGLRVPEDVSVASFDDIPFARYSVPRLTTVCSQPEQNGRAAVQLFLKRMAEPDRSREIITFQSTLIIRESTGPPPC